MKLGAWLLRYVRLVVTRSAPTVLSIVKEGCFHAADADDELSIVLGVIARQRDRSLTIDQAAIYAASSPCSIRTLR